MAKNVLVFDEYVYTDSEHDKLHPYLVLTGPLKGTWFMTGWTYTVTLKEIGALCKIPDDELMVIALKYGPGRTVAQ